jgi:hypothetical protein
VPKEEAKINPAFPMAQENALASGKAISPPPGRSPLNS